MSAVAASAVAAGVLATRDALGGNGPQESAADLRRGILFNDRFTGKSLLQSYWNPYICDVNSHGRPWLMQRAVATPSSAISAKGGFNDAYDLPSAARVDSGLTLWAYRGTGAAGYSWTGSVICSLPTSNNFGSGTVRRSGFTFADARVEVLAKMPDMTSGQWPSIWFLPANDSADAEIDLFEGGYVADKVNPNHLMSVRLAGRRNRQHLVNVHTDLSAAYHTYAMEYRQGHSIKLFLDGSHIYTYTRNVPIGPYFIILSNGMASARTVGWHTQVCKSTPAVNAMRISSVRALAL